MEVQPTSFLDSSQDLLDFRVCKRIFDCGIILDQLVNRVTLHSLLLFKSLRLILLRFSLLLVSDTLEMHPHNLRELHHKLFEFARLAVLLHCDFGIFLHFFENSREHRILEHLHQRRLRHQLLQQLWRHPLVFGLSDFLSGHRALNLLYLEGFVLRHCFDVCHILNNCCCLLLFWRLIEETGLHSAETCICFGFCLLWDRFLLRGFGRFW